MSCSIHTFQLTNTFLMLNRAFLMAGSTFLARMTGSVAQHIVKMTM